MRIALLLAATTLVACSHAVPSSSSTEEGTIQPTTTPVAAESRAKGTPIFSIVTHDSKVMVLGGGDLRVVIRKMDGTLVADGISLDELRATDPAIHTLVTSAMASNGGGGTPKTFLYAGY